MDDGAAIALGVGAVLLVFLYTRHQEQKTAAMIAAAQQPPKPSGPYALSINDQIAIGGSILATYFGGPATGAKVAGVLAS